MTNITINETVTNQPTMSVEDFELACDHINTLDEWDRNSIYGSFIYLGLSSMANNINFKQTVTNDQAIETANNRIDSITSLVGWAMNETPPSAYPTIDKLNELEERNIGGTPSKEAFLGIAIRSSLSTIRKSSEGDKYPERLNIQSAKKFYDSIKDKNVKKVLDAAVDAHYNARHQQVEDANAEFERIVAQLYADPQGSLTETSPQDLFFQLNIAIGNIERNMDRNELKALETTNSEFWAAKNEKLYFVLRKVKAVIERNKMVLADVTTDDSLDHQAA